MSNSLSFMHGAFRVESARCCSAGMADGLGSLHGMEFLA